MPCELEDGPIAGRPEEARSLTEQARMHHEAVQVDQADVAEGPEQLTAARENVTGVA